ncbi:MAG: stage V sporulation protein AD [Clostridia bacterium]|nr:stage V sporulation protein AD [Clostridia bacterium]
MSRITVFDPARRPRILAAASAVGGEEFHGPLGPLFDYHDESDRFGADTWEHAEGALSHVVLSLALKRAGMDHREPDVLFAGDLENQCVASHEGLGSFGIPYCGLYGACSTVGEGLTLASLALSAPGGARVAAVVTTSHYCAAERQFRTPLEYGSQRTPTAQWTATAGGAFLLSRDRGEVEIEAVMPGRVTDAGLRDPGNMGAAMAPAAADSLLRYLEARGEGPGDYDAIVTGDLAKDGSCWLSELLTKEGVLIRERHFDCGTLLYDYEKQDVHAGGSGCGCSAAVLAARFFPAIARGEMRRVLFLATGALMSPSSLLQGGHISGIAPVVCLRRREGDV